MAVLADLSPCAHVQIPSEHTLGQISSPELRVQQRGKEPVMPSGFLESSMCLLNYLSLSHKIMHLFSFKQYILVTSSGWGMEIEGLEKIPL